MKIIRKWGPILVCAAVTSEVVHMFISNNILAMFVSVGISSVLYLLLKGGIALRQRIKRVGDEHLKKHPYSQNMEGER